jgi:C_GCAxxG_C_C family probable redox protein
VKIREEDQNLVEDAVNYFRDGLYCSEAILHAFNGHYELGISDDILKIATGFGVGLGGSKCSCGSLTGGVMVLSLVFGRSGADQSDAAAVSAVAELYSKFKKEFGASCCRVLTKPVVWGSPEHHKYCERYVRSAVELTDAILRNRLQVVDKKIS